MFVSVLDERAEKMLNAIRECGPGWHGRSEIASQLGKVRLTDADVLTLDYLLKEGRIEAEKHEIDANIPFRWEYRIIE